MKGVYPIFENNEEFVNFGCLRFFISQRKMPAERRGNFDFVKLFCDYHQRDFSHVKSMLEYYGATQDIDVLNISPSNISDDMELRSDWKMISCDVTGVSTFTNGKFVNMVLVDNKWVLPAMA